MDTIAATGSSSRVSLTRGHGVSCQDVAICTNKPLRWACWLLLTGCGGRTALLSASASENAALPASEAADGQAQADGGPACRARGILAVTQLGSTAASTLVTFSPESLVTTVQGTIVGDGSKSCGNGQLAVARDGGVLVGLCNDTFCQLSENLGCASPVVQPSTGSLLLALTFTGGADGESEALYGSWDRTDIPTSEATIRAIPLDRSGRHGRPKVTRRGDRIGPRRDAERA